MRNTLFWANIVTATSFVCLANAVIYAVVNEPTRRILMVCLVSTLILTSVSEVANVGTPNGSTVSGSGGEASCGPNDQHGRRTHRRRRRERRMGAGDSTLCRWLARNRPCLFPFAVATATRFDHAEFRRLLPAAIAFAGNSSLAALETRLPDLVLAVFSTLDQLATYRIASGAVNSITSLICQPIASVATASMAVAPFNKGTIYLAHVRLLLWVGAVPFAGLLFFGDIVVPMVFGATWAGSGLIAQILATLFFVDGQVWLTRSALIASGRPNDLLKCYVFWRH